MREREPASVRHLALLLSPLPATIPPRVRGRPRHPCAARGATAPSGRSGADMARIMRWAGVVAIVALVAVVPLVHYRYVYARGKRLREVDPGRVYRSGQLNADGFREARDLYGLRTVICLRDDDPDPDVELGFLPGSGTVKESELCRRLGLRFVFIAPDLVSRREVHARRPEAIERFLEVMDDPESYPVLIHCNAGLNRTGVLVAVYRMEYQG